MNAEPFLPADVEPRTALDASEFRLEPLGPQHNEADLAAWIETAWPWERPDRYGR